MKSSALDMLTPRYADRLPSDAKRILATLFDDVPRLAYYAHMAADKELRPTHPKNSAKNSAKDPAEAVDDFMPALRKFIDYGDRVNARAGELLRGVMPALGVLSDKAITIVSIVGREAMIARKYGVDTTDTVAILRRGYALAVDALVWAFLYCKFGKISPTTPLAEVLSADELGLTGANPATLVGDVLPRDALVEACCEACDRAFELVSTLDFDLEFQIGRDLRGPKPTVENVVTRHFEILRNTMHASGPRADLNEFKTPSGREIRAFVSPPGNPNIRPLGYDDPTLKNGGFMWIHQEHWIWCRRAERREGKL